MTHAIITMAVRLLGICPIAGAKVNRFFTDSKSFLLFFLANLLPINNLDSPPPFALAKVIPFFVLNKRFFKIKTIFFRYCVYLYAYADDNTPDDKPVPRLSF